MPAIHEVLPDLNSLDAEALRARVLERHTELISYKTALISHKQEIENLKLLIAKLRQMQFGRKLCRQSDIYAREGIELDRSTLASRVGGVSALLEPLVDALRQYVLAATQLHGDDIPIPVLASGNGKTKTARLWTYVRDDRPGGCNDAPAMWFADSLPCNNGCKLNYSSS